MTDHVKGVIFVVSDSLGETGEVLANAAKSQFDSNLCEIRKFPFVITNEQVDEILYEAKEIPSILVYTVTSLEIAAYIKKQADLLDIPSIDALGPIVNSFQEKTGEIPKRKPGLNRLLDADYFKKVEAVEFAVKYDDGKDPRGVYKADIVLIGVSRTSKTPLSMYLANKNLKVANIPLVPEIDAPKDLFEISRKKVIGLTTDPEKLVGIRMERLRSLGLDNNANYASLDRVFAELEHAQAVFDQLRCPVINVSSKAIEETASIILSIINRR
jgi:regulator of PEP synthase PpsR (kinase-PPPase family)